MKITFVGSGYVGLVSGVMMSHLGHFVTCIDIDQDKINKLKNLESPIFEDGLEDFLIQYGNTERLNFICGYNESLYESSAIFIAVGTPQKSDGNADLHHIFEAVMASAKYANPDCVFVIKSTVPPGTCKQIKDLLVQNGFNNTVISNPEFLREGSAVHDFLHPDRIILGSESKTALEVIKQIYKPLCDEGIIILETDLITAELIKYASNSFLACKIAFINEMADLCEVIGADINQLSSGVGLDKRIGSAFLKVGPGFGGSCFPKDILALQHLTNNLKSDSLILDAVITANTHRPKLMIKKIKMFLDDQIQGKKIAILGLTYKAGTDDLRSSPVIELINLLWENGAEIKAYDPQGMPNSSKYFNNNLVCGASPFEVCDGADAVIVATEWPEFTKIDYKKLKAQLNSPNIIDLRNFLDRKMLHTLGYRCYSVGQKTTNMA
ncbi:MAG: UDP-glucose/GDP-mannose dehydrogenase family protein [Rickettsiaceae bacterium]